jgi:hypothetical protein
VVREICEGRK